MTNNEIILKSQQRFKSERHNVFTDEINKIALNSNDDEGIQSIDSIETYAYRTKKMKILTTINKYSILVIIHLSQNIMII